MHPAWAQGGGWQARLGPEAVPLPPLPPPATCEFSARAETRFTYRTGVRVFLIVRFIVPAALLQLLQGFLKILTGSRQLRLILLIFRLVNITLAKLIRGLVLSFESFLS